MPSEIELKLEPSKVFDETHVRSRVCHALKINSEDIQSIVYLKRSIDARKKPVMYLLRLKVYMQGEIQDSLPQGFKAAPFTSGKKVAIIGFGPAGMFAALQLMEMGIKPLVFERGKKVKERRRDLAAMNKELIVNPESNYCFGEGGAGTYSDGKLYTRSKKRGNVLKVLQTFVDHGADNDILVNAHPHIGTNKLPGIIEHMRDHILECGGEIHFNSKLTDFRIEDNKVRSILINHKEIAVDAVILATGHSARDIFELLDKKHLHLEAKPFALGVRVEHPQQVIDQLQYGDPVRSEYLPPASYSLVTQAAGNGVFSFCMCPGGIIAPAATDDAEVVVNGWSPSKRNGRFANSGMVVTVNPQHWQKDFGNTPLSAMAFQQSVERKAFEANMSIVAPAVRMEDFVRHRMSSDLPECSYLPGVNPADLYSILPPFISRSLEEGLVHFGKSMKAYMTNEAILVGVESRTSSPVRIPRDKETLRHTQVDNLFPCGEGAGYAGGIVSAALDGMACAIAVNDGK